VDRMGGVATFPHGVLLCEAMASTTQHLTVRLSPRILMKLKVASKLERRSRSQLVRLLIEDYLADLEKSGVTWEDEGEER
jgi:hypothetical protein